MTSLALPRLVRPDAPAIVIYVRQSLDASGEGAAVSRQEDRCREYAAARYPGVPVLRVYVENDTSATKGTRSVFAQMLADARAGQFTLILCYHLDRATRSLKDFIALTELARDYGVGTTTTTGELDLTTDTGRLLGGILSVVANAEVERKSDRQKLANATRAKEGLPPVGGTRLFGYEADSVTLRPSESAAVAKAYADFLAGASLASIARSLNASGFRTAKLGNEFSHKTVRDLLSNSRYAGLRSYRGEIVAQGKWPAVVEEGTYRAVVALLSDVSRRTYHGSGERRWLGTAIYQCGVCQDGTTMVANYASSNGKHGRAVYRCRLSKHLVRDAVSIDAYVVEAVMDRLCEPDAMGLLIGDAAPATGELQMEAMAITARMDLLADDFATGAITHRQFTVANTRLRADLAARHQVMAQASQRAVLLPLIAPGDRAAVEAVWASLGVDQRRAVLTTVIEAAVVHKGKAGGTAAQRRKAMHVKIRYAR